MALIGSPSSFAREAAPSARKCSECERRFPVGHVWLVARKFGRVQKRVCSEDCRQTFDYRYWRERAQNRALAGGDSEEFR
jgi:hypothetical protein